MTYDCAFNLKHFYGPDYQYEEFAKLGEFRLWAVGNLKGGLMTLPGYSIMRSISAGYLQGAKSINNNRETRNIWLLPASQNTSGKDILIEQRGSQLILAKTRPEDRATLGFLPKFYTAKRSICPIITNQEQPS